MNVGDGANGCTGSPQWRLWDGSGESLTPNPSDPTGESIASTGGAWKRVGPAQALAARQPHTLVLKGEVGTDQRVRYLRLVSDGVEQPSDPAVFSFAPKGNDNRADGVVVAIQLDGNCRGGPAAPTEHCPHSAEVHINDARYGSDAYEVTIHALGLQWW